jgi:hypothetical protein
MGEGQEASEESCGIVPGIVPNRSDSCESPRSHCLTLSVYFFFVHREASFRAHNSPAVGEKIMRAHAGPLPQNAAYPDGLYP